MSTVDDAQKYLKEAFFQHAKSQKKAAGRAIGTILEIIVYFILETYDLIKNMTVEYRLPEYGPNDVVHNVEYGIHPNIGTIQSEMSGTVHKNLQIPRSIQKAFGNSKDLKRSIRVLEYNNKADRKIRINNRLFVSNIVDWNYDEIFVGHLLDNSKGEILVLQKSPIAYIECKRVGREEGTKTGPTSIEKAKQASYVALRTSRLQKFFGDDAIYGILPIRTKDGIGFRVEPYSDLWLDLLRKERYEDLIGVVRSTVFVSNHVNWYINDREKKDLSVIKQSHDWTIWVNDYGIVEFIDKFLNKDCAVKDAFTLTYIDRKGGGSLFTKTRMETEAYALLNKFFRSNIEHVKKNWLKVLSPSDRSLDDMMKELKTILRIHETALSKNKQSGALDQYIKR